MILNIFFTFSNSSKVFFELETPSFGGDALKGVKAFIRVLLAATALATVQLMSGHGGNMIIKCIALEPDSQLISLLYAVILSYNVQNLKGAVI